MHKEEAIYLKTLYNMEKQLKDVNWGEFKIGTIFKIENCKCSNVSTLSKGRIPYVGATNRNNGILRYVEESEKLITSGKCIAFICDGEGSVGLSIYKESDFIGSTTVKVGRNEHLNKYVGTFITSIADNSAKGKYNFGFKRNESHLKNEILLLPTTPEGLPDYAFMEEYMREKEQEKINAFQKQITQRIVEVKNYKEVIPLSEKDWEGFFIDDISEIISGRDIYEAERKKGNIPYITATANNNGIGYFVGNSNQTLEANCLSVNRNGSVGYAFYHEYPALFSNDCRKLRLNNPSKFVGIFISQQITRQKEKYGYGYKMGTARLKRQKIMLPINTNGQPDYEYMEHYIKKIEYQKLMAFLEMKNILL